MKVLPFKIPRNHGFPVMLQHDRLEHTYSTLHQHPELQMTLIRESSGTVVIGGYIGEFHPRDVFIVGSNVPHVFRNDELTNPIGAVTVSDIIYVFLDDKIPDAQLLDYREIDELFLVAGKGIRLSGSLNSTVGERIEKMLELKGFELLIEVLSIINLLSKSKELVYLNNEIVKQRIDENDGQRLNDVIQYSFAHYTERITLEQVAEVANMVPSAFCRFFKHRTRKTYFDFLNEIRIRAACKLLLNKDLTIVEICFQAGFNNLSYFNRKFKKLTGYSPLKYHKALNGD